MKIKKNLRIPQENHANHENHRIALENHDNHENPKIQLESYEIFKIKVFHVRLTKFMKII